MKPSLGLLLFLLLLFLLLLPLLPLLKTSGGAWSNTPPNRTAIDGVAEDGFMGEH